MPSRAPFFAILLVLPLLGGCTASPDDFDFDTCGVRPRAVLPIDIVRDVPIVHGRINDAPASLILDTGAENIVLTSDATARLALKSDANQVRTMRGAGGEFHMFPAMLHDFELNGLAVPDHLVPVLPRALPKVGDLAPDGLLGVTVLSSFELELDFPRRRMTLYAGRLCPDTVVPNWRGPYSTLNADRSVRGRFIVPIEINGHAMTALIDTGTQTSVIAADAALAAGVDNVALAHDLPDIMRGAGPDLVPTHIHRFAEIRVGDEVFRNDALLVTDRLVADADVILGMDYLSTHRIWLSYARKRVFIARHPDGGPQGGVSPSGLPSGGGAG